jgi:hypothetical protein
MSERNVQTEIILNGANLERFLDFKNVPGDQKGENGSIVVASFSGDENCVDTALGKIGLDFGLINDSRNRAIVIFSTGLRRKGGRKVRKVSINHKDGFGKQQLTNGVNLIVRTNAPAQFFGDSES